MKELMTELSLTETKRAAVEKWREYVAAEKIYRKPEYTDLKKVYNQIKGGRKVIDIFKVIQNGGVRENQHPILAIAQANTKSVWCKYYLDGKLSFINRTDQNWRNSPARLSNADVSFEKWLPSFDKLKIPLNNGWRPDHFQLRAPVPPIPAKFLPKNITDDHYILWEVDQWDMVPPTDPWLLKRITKNLFVVLAGWDLTEIEKSVMRGRMI